MGNMLLPRLGERDGGVGDEDTATATANATTHNAPSLQTARDKESTVPSAALIKTTTSYTMAEYALMSVGAHVKREGRSTLVQLCSRVLSQIFMTVVRAVYVDEVMVVYVELQTLSRQVRAHLHYSIKPEHHELRCFNVAFVPGALSTLTIMLALRQWRWRSSTLRRIAQVRRAVQAFALDVPHALGSDKGKSVFQNGSSQPGLSKPLAAIVSVSAAGEDDFIGSRVPLSHANYGHGSWRPFMRLLAAHLANGRYPAPGHYRCRAADNVPSVDESATYAEPLRRPTREVEAPRRHDPQARSDYNHLVEHGRRVGCDIRSLTPP